MKYEADIIKDIVDSRGHEKSSIHYQSECVEEWVKEVEGAYPKLCDYQPEWLNYSAENKVGVFPYVALTDVASATVENVVPYAYKSAILRGQTLKNINDYSIITSSNVTIDNDGVITINAQSKYTEVFIKSLENKSSTKYLVKIKVIENTLSGDFNLNAPANGSVIFDNAFKIIKSGYVGEETIIYTTASDLTNAQFTFRSYLSSSVASGSIKYQLSVIEYQDGMENWDIPYFEGMQSVKMPVLTTVGKNLYNKSPFNGYVDSSSGKFVSGPTTRKISDYIEVEPNKKYKVSGCTMTTMWGYDKDKNPISSINIYADITTTSDMRFIAFTINSEVEHSNIQLEEGTVATSYEPHKSNILSVNEDVTLRGIGDVRDELNCLTGEVTERIGEIVLDGSQNIDNEGNLFYYYLPYSVQDNISKCDKLSSITVSDILNGKMGVAPQNRGDHSRIYIIIDEITNKEEMKNYFSQNPTKFQFKLVTESIKTVDLTVVDQDGNTLERIKPIEGTMHLNTSGETIKPLFSGEIPVEAITQNLASFIEE